MSNTATSEEAISVVSEESLPKYEYKYSFESSYEFLEEEIGATKSPKNYNKKYGVPQVTELNEFTKSTKDFLEWLMAEHPDALKIPKECPCCGSTKLKIHGRNVRCYACANKGKEFKQSVWKDSYFDG